MTVTEPDAASEFHCPGARCEDCTPEEDCCEATCGVCPRVTEHDLCWLHTGSEDDSKYCSEHGEGWLGDETREGWRRWLRYDMDQIAARQAHASTGGGA
ncbi:hypothetical protein OG552_10770 [Streptomyces sp. NBC_01476]|uniref:hypothetical protein n=1 Tax=Streptomyces sp. NBC_01476 TaxID=2903881 RepID=UPI002E33AEB1|nr:hypothetical protein [Streptomyces sp. NBC_01476]